MLVEKGAKQFWDAELADYLNIEAKLDHIPVLDDILFALQSELAGLAGLGLRAASDQILKRNNLCCNKSTLEIAVDHARRSRGFVTRVDRPCAGFLRSGREVGAKAKEMVGGADEQAHAAVFDAQASQKLPGFFRRQVGEFAFDLRADHDRAAAEVLRGIVAHRAHMLRGGRISLKIREVVFADIAGEERRLGGQEEKTAQDVLFGIGEFEGERGLAGVEMGDEFFREGDFGFSGFVSAARGFLVTLGAFFYRGEIGEDELGVDHFDVAHGIDRSRDMVDVGTLEATHDLDDRIDLADVAQELISEALALTRASDQSGDIHKLNCGGQDFFRLRHCGQLGQPVIRHIHDADIGLDRAKRKIRRLRLAGASDGIEEGGLSDIRQSDDSGFQHRGGTLATRSPKEKSSFARASRLY